MLFGIYFEYYLFILPALILVLIAQASVRSRYKKYSRIGNSRNMTGAQMAEYLLHSNGINDVAVVCVPGNLTDNYDPRNKTISLSTDVYNGTSVAAVGIAAHEAGHAAQYANGYFPVKLRMAIIPVCNIGSTLSFPLLIIGAILNFPYLIYAGLILFASVTFFQFVTLPVEFNASARAMNTIKNCGFFTQQDISGARGMLTAAAMTYVAAFAQSLLSFLYYFLRFTGRRR